MPNSYIDGVIYPGSSGTEYGIGSPGTLLSDQMKQALLACFANVAWIGDDGQDYYDALEAALYPQYTVTYNLTNVNSSNQSTSAGGSYTSTLTATTGFISSVTITMGGVDITSSAFTPSS